ncbi:MAG: sulfite exporter TauE/SafE family protein [Opitutaceae bacterium]
MDASLVHSPAAAFVAGLVTSLHCVGMCAPLVCSLQPVKSDGPVFATTYHAARLTGYAGLGAVAGGLGRLPLAWVSDSALHWLPWFGVFVFVALAFRWDRHLPKNLALGRLMWRVRAWVRGRPPAAAAAALGIATPLLPCGPLYLVVALALLAGSAAQGATVLLAFGLGTVPLLWLAQTQFRWLRERLTPVWMGRLRVTLALVSALVIGWRARGTLGFAGPDMGGWICF